ncbi:MAG: hypothetical protein JNM02_04560 [Anaerolineales bacterium]|nr:hypothetical protein [Anaerolineales bacterium]
MSDKTRRTYGFIIGLAFGFPYSLISQFINVWALPGVPLFEMPIGRIPTVVLSSLFMGLIGLIVAWDEESFWGLLGSGILAVFASSLFAFINSGESQVVTSFFLSLFTFLPRLIFYLPLGLFFRWLVGSLDAAGRTPSSPLSRLLKVTALILVVAVIGGRFSQMAPEAKDALRDMNALVLEGMSAVENGEKVPEPLIPVDGFTRFAKGAYTLEWSSDVDSLPVTRPIAGFGVIESLIIVRFENDYQFGCAFTPPSHIPKCINITRVR